MSARYEARDGVAVITLDNPPVNGLSHATRNAVADAILDADMDASVQAIVLTGAGKAFSGGADIREFNSPAALADPTLFTLISLVEGSRKPVVAALHSVCMGGGLELALGCHYRVAARGTKIALPEVRLGLLPGAGGTQRLPRALGVERALQMVLTGDTALSEDLAAVPDQHLIDLLVDGDLLGQAAAFALDRARDLAEGQPLPRLRDRPAQLSDPALDATAFFAERRAPLAARSHQLPAPLRCLEAVQAAVEQPFDEGLRTERAAFMNLVVSPASSALRHAFFAERSAGKIDDLPKDASAHKVRQALVLGPQASAWSALLQGAGLQVSSLAADAASPEQLAAADLLLFTDPKDAASLQALAMPCGADALLLVASSDLSPWADQPLGQRLLGLSAWPAPGAGPESAHWLELARLPAARPDALATGLALLRQLGLPAIITGSGAESIAATLLKAGQQALSLYPQADASSHSLAAALQDFGWPLPTVNALAGEAPSRTEGGAEGSAVDLKPVHQAMAQAAQALLDGGRLQRASDGDLASLVALGFPRWQGGLLRWASLQA